MEFDNHNKLQKKRDNETIAHYNDKETLPIRNVHDEKHKTYNEGKTKRVRSNEKKLQKKEHWQKRKILQQNHPSQITNNSGETSSHSANKNDNLSNIENSRLNVDEPHYVEDLDCYSLVSRIRNTKTYSMIFLENTHPKESGQLLQNHFRMKNGDPTCSTGCCLDNRNSNLEYADIDKSRCGINEPRNIVESDYRGFTSRISKMRAYFTNLMKDGRPEERHPPTLPV